MLQQAALVEVVEVAVLLAVVKGIQGQLFLDHRDNCQLILEMLAMIIHQTIVLWLSYPLLIARCYPPVPP